ncbi:MAG: thiamine ABC transporter substrate-binding protein [Treponema sp.]|jgi:thiamine transport system substrate-binding protein|nr:thiamine ABC transporter substrate-binding protein [Treponema sp.]
MRYWKTRCARLRQGVLIPALILFTLGISPLFAGARRDRPQTGGSSGGELVIWTYDSFNSEWGPGPEVKKRFEALTGITLTWVNHGDAGAVLSRLLLEGKDAGADIILGLDQNMADKALSSGLLEAYKPAGAEDIFPELVIDPSYRLIPMDYSYFAIIYDSQRLPNPPKSLEDLAKGEYAGSLILMDPRTSSPGLGFLAWTLAVYGGDWTDYWRRLKPSILTVAPGWDTGYGLFTAGEAPLVLSYTTSPGYHLEYENTERYQAAIFTDGHPVQIEAAGLLGAGKNKENARKFLDFMVSPGFQDVVPLTNWMYPVTPIPLPSSFRINPKSDKPLRPPAPTDAELNRWAALMAE